MKRVQFHISSYRLNWHLKINRELTLISSLVTLGSFCNIWPWYQKWDNSGDYSLSSHCQLEWTLLLRIVLNRKRVAPSPIENSSTRLPSMIWNQKACQYQAKKHESQFHVETTDSFYLLILIQNIGHFNHILYSKNMEFNNRFIGCASIVGWKQTENQKLEGRWNEWIGSLQYQHIMLILGTPYHNGYSESSYRQPYKTLSMLLACLL